jgi:UDP-N-acetylglucosamine--dolichyl-phosphate N-acetylglucosaminephosphotransferase
VTHPGLIEASTFPFDPQEANIISKLIISIFGFLRLVRIKKTKKESTGRKKKGEREEEIWHVSNFTLISLVLVTFGPLREDQVTLIVMAIQTLGTLIGFFIRYGLASIVYNDLGI